MGHTFCAPPSEPPTTPAKSEERLNSGPLRLQARSPGVPGTLSNWGQFVDATDQENQTKLREITEERNTLLTLKEVLINNKPPIAASIGKGTGQRRGRKILRVGSRQLRRMLMVRRDAEKWVGMKGLVAPRVTQGGMRYAQIMAPPAEVYGKVCGNPSVYRVNEVEAEERGRGKEKGKGKGKKSMGKEGRERWSLIDSTDEEDGERWMSAAQPHGNEKETEPSPKREFLAPITSVENSDAWDFGITEDYLLRKADSEEEVQDHRLPEPLLPPPLNLGNAERTGGAGFGWDAAFPRPNFKERAALAIQASQGQSKAGGAVSCSPGRHEGQRAALHVAKRRPAKSFSTHPQSQAAVPCTPENFIDKRRGEILGSPSVNDHTQAPSARSTNGSVVEDGRSEVSSSTSTMARCTELLRPYYYNGEIHEFPKPGPAPTSALPSLPEGQSSRTSIVILPSLGLDSARATSSAEASPIRTPPSPRAKKYRFRPMDDVMSEDTVRMLSKETRSDTRPQTAQSYQSDQSQKPRRNAVSGDAALTGNTTASPHKPDEDERREKRTRSRKELKLRDMDRLRSQRNSIVVESQATAGRAEIKEAANSREAATANVPESSEPSPSDQPRSSSLDWRAAESDVRDCRHPASTLSPVLVVAEQRPSLPIAPSIAPDSPKSRRPSKKSRTRKERYPQSRAPSPSLPSSDEDSIYRMQRSKAAKARRHSNSQASSTPRSHSSTQEIEAKFEARIAELEKKDAELEKKNAQLLNALIAVINTPSGSAASSLANGHGSSGSSGRSSGGGSGHSVIKGNHLGGVSELYAPLEEVASKLSRMS